MEFDTEPTVNEEELDDLGMKKKDSATVDLDLPEDDTAVLPEDEDGAEKDDEKGIFGDDPELEAYMLGEENY